MSATDPLREMTERLVETADWYVRCLEDVQDRRPVSGLDEAKIGYTNALHATREALAAVPAEPEQSVILEALDRHGLEANPIGTRAALAAVSKPCPECHGDGYHCDDSHPANLTEPCEPCGGHGVVPADVRPAEPEAWEWRVLLDNYPHALDDEEHARREIERCRDVDFGHRPAPVFERRRPGIAPGEWERVDPGPRRICACEPGQCHGVGGGDCRREVARAQRDEQARLQDGGE